MIESRVKKFEAYRQSIYDKGSEFKKEQIDTTLRGVEQSISFSKEDHKVLKTLKIKKITDICLYLSILIVTILLLLIYGIRLF